MLVSLRRLARRHEPPRLLHYSNYSYGVRVLIASYNCDRNTAKERSYNVTLCGI